MNTTDKQKTAKPIASKLSRRSAYTLAAGAAAAAVGGESAEAYIVYSGIQDLSIAQLSSQDLNLDGDDYNDILLKNYVFGGGNYQGSSVNFAPGRLVGFQLSYAYASALGAGELVDSTTTGPSFIGSLAYGAFNPAAEFNSVTNAYIGLSFPINTFLHNAWIRVSIDNAAGIFTVHDWAYESVVDAGILTGDTGTPTNGLFGDFNSDGVVDAADYTVYRDNLGTDAFLGGNGDESGLSTGIVDIEDYDIWVLNYGTSLAPPEEAVSVPEPGTLGLLAAGALGLSCLRKKRGSSK